MKNSSQQIAYEWYLVFTSTKLEHWIYRFIDREYGHVYAVQSLNDYQWLVVQPRVNMTQCKIMLKSQYPHINALTAPEDKVLKVKAYSVDGWRGCLNWFTCVEQVKALIGMKAPFVLTPKQLYNRLRLNNG